MTLAAILAVFLLGLGELPIRIPQWALEAAHRQPAAVTASNPMRQDQGNAPSSQAQSSAAKSPEPAKTPASATGQTQNSTTQVKPSVKTQRHKNAGVPNCSNAPTARNPKSCPPPKKVIRNGGSDEPTVQLTGGTTAKQASIERATTDQLNTATAEDLKKIAERQLTPNQQQTLTQIHEFIEQSKQAVADGDLDRGHNLALKAHLLSDELVKP